MRAMWPKYDIKGQQIILATPSQESMVTQYDPDVCNFLVQAFTDFADCK